MRALRIAVLAFGSRGDVQPYVALAKGLAKAGHETRLITHENFEGLAKAHNLDVRLVRGNVQAIVESPEMRAMLETGNFIAVSRQAAKEAKRIAVFWAEDSLAACKGVELLIAGIGGLYTALDLAEKLNIPLLQAYLLPFTPTRNFPSILLPPNAPRLGGPFNYFSHHLTRQAIWQSVRGADKTARTQVFGLPAAPFLGPYGSPRLRQFPTLYGISRHVIPQPADWGERNRVVGYWFLDAETEWTPPNDLLQFLEGGPKPVYIGFGSMANRKPEETTALVLQALSTSGQRAVIASGWDGMKGSALPDSVYMLESIPHGWLFPRVAAVVHHGGAGTTAAGLRAGVPSVITPYFGDQPFWGQRVADLGVGPTPIPRKQVTAERMADAIRSAATDPTMRQRAAQLGENIRAEDGIGEVVAAVARISERLPITKA